MPEAKKSYKKEKAQLLTSLLQQAEKKGYIRASTITDKLGRYNPSEQEKENFFAEFDRRGIEVIYSDESEDFVLNEALFTTEDFDEDEIPIPESTSFSSSLTDPLQLYLNEIHKFPTLTHKETISLINKVMSDDADAREYLINCNLKFAFTVAVKYARTGFPMLDLIQQANIGLMTAVDRYNPHRGTKFSTYAVFWIRFSILSYIKENLKIVRLPNSVLEDMGKINSVKEKYYSEHHCNPTDTELADLTGLCISRVKFIRTLDFEVVSADEKLDENDNEHTIGELLTADEEEESPFKDFYMEECRKALDSFLCNLSPREREVLRLRYGIGEKESTDNTSSTARPYCDL